MNLQSLKKQVRAGLIDTVTVAFPDTLGRLMGKRFRADFFLESVLRHGTHCCNYLLTVNMEMEPQDGFRVTNWDAGFGDFALRPDLGTLRPIPWQQGNALVLGDYTKDDGSLVAEVPRSVLKNQVQRLDAMGLECLCASELEFYLFNQTYDSAFASAYRDLQPSSNYRIDYHITQPGQDEPLMRAIRNQMTAAEIPVENSKGEWSRGQHEVNFVCTDPIRMADRHVVFKSGVKELAHQHGKCVTFMAKFAPGEAGNSCHLHLSLWRRGENVFVKGDNSQLHQRRSQKRNPASATSFGSQLFRQFLGGLMKYSPELCLFYAPTINSYKRFQPGSWAPTRMAWARDNRTVGFRVVGQNGSFRIENRMPGADANPYLAFAAMLAAGLAGVEENLDCGDEYHGNAYVDTRLPRLPASLKDAADLFDRSRLARRVFGDAVVDFYVHHARLEHQAFSDAVTDWEKARYFERI